MEEKKVHYENSGSSMTTISAIASVLALLGVGYSLFGGGIQGAVQQAISTIESQKVGGAENYALVQKIFSSDKFKETQKQQLEIAIAQLGGEWGDTAQGAGGKFGEQAVDGADAGAKPAEVAPTAPSAPSELTDEVLSNLKKDVYIKGNKDALITILEFSDLECPFCARLHTAGTPKALADKYGDKINFIFKHFPLSFHANAQKASEGAECVWEIGGSEKFYAFIESVYKTGGQPTEAVLKASAKEVGIDEAKFGECLASGKHAQKVKDAMAQGASLFWVQGTPNSVIINNQTKKYDKVEGAYPTEAFVAKIDALMK